MNQDETSEIIDDQPAPPLPVTVARLDAAGVYHGIAQIPADQVTDDHVPLPDGCDLPPGRYRWDRTAGSFMPLADAQQRAVEMPVALNAMAWGLLAMHSSGTCLPGYCLDWLDFYIKTIDFGLPDIEADKALLADYLQKRNLT